LLAESLEAWAEKTLKGDEELAKGLAREEVGAVRIPAGDAPAG
jgi:hypothetical protein